MWFQEFRRSFDRAAETFTRGAQDLSAVEKELEAARAAMRVGPEDLRCIEDSPAWTYRSWWPRLSAALDPPVALPPDLTDPAAKGRAVEDLYDRLNHIEVVSVLLRFYCPPEFGIISPPVASLLNLAPCDPHPRHYCRYLDVLDDLRRHYLAAP